MPDSFTYIIITGASDGLGLRLAHLFAEGAKDNVRLLLTGRKQFSALEHPLPLHATYIVADQTQSDCGATIFEKVKQLGWPRIDNIILNAGVGYISAPGEELPDKIIDTINVNLTAPITILHQFSNLLLTQSHNDTHRASRLPCVTFIGSPARKGAAKFASYSASKAGLSGLARALTSEWQGQVDVQIIHPGPTNTHMQSKAGLDLGKMQQFFINPDYCAREIKRLIDARKINASIGLLRYYGFLVMSKIGLIPPVKSNGSL